MKRSGLRFEICLLIKGVKLSRTIFFVFGKFCLTSRILLVSVLLSALVERFYPQKLEVEVQIVDILVSI